MLDTASVLLALGCSESDGNGAGRDEGAASTSDTDGSAAPSDAEALADYEICDGSDRLRFAHQVTGGGMVYPGDAPVTQNGHFYLFVDGTCTYYVYGRFDVKVSTPTLATHSGKLNSDQAETLARLSSLEGFDDGTYGCNVSDAPTVVFWRQDARVDLATPCPFTSGETDEGALLTQRSADLIEFMRGIYLAGSPLAGPIRLIAVEQPPDYVEPSVPRVTWPLDIPLQQVAVGYGEGSVEADESFLIENDPGLATLRSYREQVFSGIPQLLFVDSGDSTYSVHFRDVLPFEDAEGVVRLE